MSADFEKKINHFKSEIAPGIPELKGCEFSFDYAKKQIKIHCKNREHRMKVNEDVGAYLLFLPGEFYQLTLPEPDERYLLSVSVMIEFHRWHIGKNPNQPRQYFYF